MAGGGFVGGFANDFAVNDEERAEGRVAFFLGVGGEFVGAFDESAVLRRGGGIIGQSGFRPGSVEEGEGGEEGEQETGEVFS